MVETNPKNFKDYLSLQALEQFIFSLNDLQIELFNNSSVID